MNMEKNYMSNQMRQVGNANSLFSEKKKERKNIKKNNQQY